MSDIKVGPKDGKLWVNISLGGILAMTSAGFIQFWSIKGEVSQASVALHNVSTTVDKIEVKLDAASGLIGSQSQALAVLQARVTSLEAEQRRQDSRTDAIESRVRSLETKK